MKFRLVLSRFGVNSTALVKASSLRLVFIQLLILFNISFSYDLLSAQTTAPRPVVVIDLEGPIGVASVDILRSALHDASGRGAQLLVIKLNTPGGLITSMQSMVSLILDAPLPVAVYVSPSGGAATSAGTFITLAAHFAAMAPGTTIGAAHPVMGSGDDLGADARRKVENFAVSLLSAIAEQRDRNLDWASKAVRESVSITDREAVAERVVDISAADLPSLLESLEGRTATVRGAPITLSGVSEAYIVEVLPTWRQRAIAILSDPTLTMLLGFGALFGIALELLHPGSIVPGVFGAICLILSLSSAQVIPIDSTGVIFLALAVVFFIVEAFLPSFGAWGVGGVVSLILGSIYFVDTGEVFGSGSFVVDQMVVGLVALLLAAAILGLLRVGIKAWRRPPDSGAEALLREEGVVSEEFALNDGGQLRGKVFVRGELWSAIWTGSQVDLPRVGEHVTVLDREGLILSVGPRDLRGKNDEE